MCSQLMAIEHWEGLHIIEYRSLGVYVFSADGCRTLGGTAQHDDCVFSAIEYRTLGVYVFSADGHRTLGGTADYNDYVFSTDGHITLGGTAH